MIDREWTYGEDAAAQVSLDIIIRWYSPKMAINEFKKNMAGKFKFIYLTCNINNIGVY